MSTGMARQALDLRSAGSARSSGRVLGDSMAKGLWIGLALLAMLVGCGGSDDNADDDQVGSSTVETNTTPEESTTTTTTVVTTTTVAPTTTTVPPPPPTPTPTLPGTTAAASGCHPSYGGTCVPSGVSDVDCAGGSGDGPAYVGGPVSVVGPDVYDLDSDGDGVACE